MLAGFVRVLAGFVTPLKKLGEAGGAVFRCLKVRRPLMVAGVCCVEEIRDGSSPGAGPI